jgi:hypothetical protein
LPWRHQHQGRQKGQRSPAFPSSFQDLSCRPVSVNFYFSSFCK